MTHFLTEPLTFLWKASAAHRLRAPSSFETELGFGQNAIPIYLSDQDPFGATQLFALFEPLPECERKWPPPADCISDYIDARL
jgi:hypothetical protein